MRVRNTLLLVSLAAFACKAEAPKKPEAPPPEETPKTTPEAPKAKEIVLPEGTGPVATVNGVEVSRDLFNREYRQTMERYQKARHDVKPALKERLKDNIVRRLVDAEIIEQRAKKMGITLAPEELKTKWDAHKKRYGSDEAFTAFLERAGTSADDVKRTFVNNLRREQAFAAASKDLAVSKKEIRQFYKDNENRYQEPEQVKASHILLRIPPDATPETKKEKRTLADTILKEAKGGKDFAELAKKYGEDPTKDRGGDLGFFTKRRMVKPFEDAVWNLKKGQFAPVVETQFGLHVIKKTDHKKARSRSYSEVEDQIERSLLARKRNEAIRTALETWKNEAKIEIFVKGDEKIISAGTQLQKLRPGLKLSPQDSKGIQVKPARLRPNTDTKPAK